MSSVARPSTPPAVASGLDEGGTTSSMTGVSNEYPQAKDTSVDQEFYQYHLHKPPVPPPPPKEVNKLVAKIQQATAELDIYQPCSELLTLYSKHFYTHLPLTIKRRLEERHRQHITFVDHHTHYPTHFPEKVLCSVTDAPDILAVYNVEDFNASKGVYTGIPHHRVEGIVEAKPKRDYGGRPQASAYAYRHHQARPDHPMIYSLVVRPDWYQVILSSPVGVVASPRTLWADLSVLASYVYAHYDPPRDHFLVDDTITWTPGDAPADPPTWAIKLDGKTYDNGRFIFIGEPWGQRTTVFTTRDKTGEVYVIKDTFRHFKRRFAEEDILTHIHAQGDLPGIVRLHVAEQVRSQNKIIQCGSEAEGTLRIKNRLALHDYGERLLKARSLNDLLETIYDALEVHRTLLTKRRVLHRDMSIYNILMYPQWKNIKDRKVADDAPPLIDDVLSGTTRPMQERVAKCLTIDVDHAVMLDHAGTDVEDELMHRTGTPMYIARSVCIGMVVRKRYALEGVQMPVLTGEALRLYVEAYGQSRLDLYNDPPDGTTCHGGTPPSKATVLNMNPEECPKFTHLPEHDVESIWWALLVASLRVRPKSSQEKHIHKDLVTFWKIMNDHMIPHNPTLSSESRHTIIAYEGDEWASLYTSEMQDFAKLIHKISLQIAPEYAFWTWEAGSHHEDHLHEAVQRLILQYLVDHRDNPIPLDPDNLRPTAKAEPVTMEKIHANAGGDLGKPGTSTLTSQQKAVIRGGRRGTRGTDSARMGSSSNAVRTSTTKTSKRRSAASTNANSEPYVTGSKRRTASQSERSSKRRKNAAGSAVSTRDDEGAGEGHEEA